MIYQWSRVAAIALVAILLGLILSAVAVIVAIVVVVSCFFLAYLLLRAALTDFSTWEPIKSEPSSEVVTSESLDSVRSEIAKSTELDYQEAYRALEATLVEWEKIVETNLGLNIFDGVTDVDRWPLNNSDIRLTTGLAVGTYIEVTANPPVTTRSKSQRARQIDERNFRLRAAIGEHSSGRSLR